MEQTVTPRTTSAQGDVLRFLIFTTVMYASFNHDCFQIEGPWRQSYHGSDAYMVLNRLKLAQDGVATFHPLAANYFSQVGLQGVILSELMRATGSSPIPFAFAMASVFALITAGTLAVFFVSIGRQLDQAAALIGVILTALSPQLLAFAPSLYWATFLLFAPFVGTWIAFPWLSRKRSRYPLLAGMLFAAALVKCLCGYEYVTTVVLSPLPAMLFHLVRMGRWSSGWILGLAGAAAAGCVGFAAALLLHAIQLQQVMHVDGIAAIQNRAAVRTVNADPVGRAEQENPMSFSHPILRSWPKSVSYPVNCFLEFFRLPAFEVRLMSRTAKVQVRFICALAALAMLGLRRRAGLSAESRALLAATALSACTSLSWQVLAVNHMCVHRHLNVIVFYAPFLLLAYVVAGRGLTWLCRAGRMERLSPLLANCCLAACLLVSGRQLVLTERAARPDQVPEADLGGLLEHASVAANYHINSVSHLIGPDPALTSELGRSTLVEKEPRVDVWGWCANGSTRPGHTRFVLVRGGEVIPCWAEFRDRPDVERALGRSVPNAGFHVSFPAGYWEGPDPPRLYLMTGRKHEPAVELKLPPKPGG